MVKVAYTTENVDKCQCGTCGVFQSSQCIRVKNAAINWTPGYLPPAEAMEGIYCAVSKSKCGDLDGSKDCLCPTCAVWDENALAQAHPSVYFCLRGAPA
ncbi:MAG: DUF2769 domain-containing protein [Chloroflexota bacterium]